MIGNEHDDYYVARERQERKLARDAADASIAAIHSDLANRYARLADSRAATSTSSSKLRLV
jgi:hypothetical protein